MNYDIQTFGAVGDGQTCNTAAVQAAIDTCHENGGGHVIVAQGRYVIGTIYLKSHVVLHVQAGAELLGSIDPADYATDTHKQMYRGETHMDRCLIFARQARQIGIVGQGLIDGRGTAEHFSPSSDPADPRPMLLRFVDCSSIRMHDITLIRPASWTTAWLYCSEIAIDHVRIHSRANINGDGLDFDGCTDVRVTNCSFDTSDDSICLQTSRVDRPCRDVTISNCTFTSKWAGVRIGLLSRGDFENVTLSNCVFRDIDDAGLKIQMCEGGEMKRMAFSNLVMHNVPRPVFVTFCQQRACTDAPAELAPMRAMRDLVFSNILADATQCGKDAGIILTGMPNHPLENITLHNINLRCGGGGDKADARRQLNELTPDVLEGHWPEYRCLGGAPPAFGLYARHVRGLTTSHLNFHTVHPDDRPSVVEIDVE
jgi:hypothetical protein